MSERPQEAAQGSPQAFGAALHDHRVAAGLSIARAAKLANVSPQNWAYVERGSYPNGPSRANVVKMALAVGWDLDDALARLNMPKATEDEQLKVLDYRTLLDRYWDDLTETQQMLFVNLAASIVHPRQPLPIDGDTKEQREPKPKGSRKSMRGPRFGGGSNQGESSGDPKDVNVR